MPTPRAIARKTHENSVKPPSCVIADRLARITSGQWYPLELAQTIENDLEAAGYVIVAADSLK